MKADLNEDVMTALKDAMEALQIPDTHDNRIKFANHCVQVGAAISVMSRLFEETRKQDFPVRFEGYASAKPETRPEVCPECNTPIVQGPNGKWCCNCMCWPDRDDEL